jgi:hypothetical protein
MAAYIAQKINIVKTGKPILVICGQGIPPVKAQKTVKLRMYGGGILIQFFITEHLPHLGFARRIADTRRSPAKQSYAPMPRSAEMAVGKKGDHVSYMEAGAGGIAAYVKSNRAFIHRTGKPFGITALGEKPSHL